MEVKDSGKPAKAPKTTRLQVTPSTSPAQIARQVRIDKRRGAVSVEEFLARRRGFRF